LKTLQALAVKEDLEGMDECVNGLIDVCIRIEVANERVAKKKLCLARTVLAMVLSSG
jgi:hypothetical protein